jgi:hypothetical protein
VEETTNIVAQRASHEQWEVAGCQNPFLASEIPKIANNLLL